MVNVRVQGLPAEVADFSDALERAGVVLERSEPCARGGKSRHVQVDMECDASAPSGRRGIEEGGAAADFRWIHWDGQEVEEDDVVTREIASHEGRYIVVDAYEADAYPFDVCLLARDEGTPRASDELVAAVREDSKRRTMLKIEKALGDFIAIRRRY